MLESKGKPLLHAVIDAWPQIASPFKVNTFLAPHFESHLRNYVSQRSQLEASAETVRAGVADCMTTSWSGGAGEMTQVWNEGKFREAASARRSASRGQTEGHYKTR
jgi:hypothetical protein